MVVGKLRGVKGALTRVLGVAAEGVGIVGGLSRTVQRRARCVWGLRTINDGSAMKEDATKLDLTLVACDPRCLHVACMKQRGLRHSGEHNMLGLAHHQ